MANPKETGDKAEDDKKTTAPAENPAETTEKQPETTPEQGADTASDGDKVEKTESKSSETEKADKKSAKTDEKKADEPSIYFVPGYGNIVGAKSQADAEKKAKKIIADRRK